MPTERANFLDVGFDVLSATDLLDRIAKVGPDSAYGYLVTPNVDHLVRLHTRSADLPQLADIYRQAAYCTCDSKILAMLAKWHGIGLPVIPGSDLTAHLFRDVVKDGDRIAVVGGDPLLLDALRRKFPRVDIVQHCPPMGLMQDPAARSAAARFIAESRARFTFLCVGSPQQEIIAAEAAALDGSRGLALCVGAALEFLTGRSRRAPLVARRLGLEWAHRLASNPRRLWRRYLVEGPRILALAYRWRPPVTSS
ncbi:MAG: WecB/TagA/CpsF family glycosyltransferase [Pseudomonadota bacterium]|nr:WecB/TagA/CpsF family glycosyltransferase [Pseudomonadota bacterium]